MRRKKVRSYGNILEYIAAAAAAANQHCGVFVSVYRCLEASVRKT